MSKTDIAIPRSEELELRDTVLSTAEPGSDESRRVLAAPLVCSRCAAPIVRMSKTNDTVLPSAPIELQDNALPTAESHSDEPRRMLNEAQILDLLPFGRTTLNNLIKAGAFPRGTYVSPNRRAWFADQIARWQTALSENNPLYNPNRGRGRGRRPRISIIKGHKS
jgi:prophage regulatory protein